MKPDYKIAVIDNHRIVRQLNVELLNRIDGFHVVLSENDFIDCKNNWAEAILPDVALIDLYMPNGRAFELLGWMKQAYPHVRTICWTMQTGSANIEKALAAGADGYLYKWAELNEWKTVIQRVAST